MTVVNGSEASKGLSISFQTGCRSGLQLKAILRSRCLYLHFRSGHPQPTPNQKHRGFKTHYNEDLNHHRMAHELRVVSPGFNFALGQRCRQIDDALVRGSPETQRDVVMRLHKRAIH